MLIPSVPASGLAEAGHSDLRSSLKKQFGIWRALHESVVFVHDPEKQYRWPRPEMAARRHTGMAGAGACSTSRTVRR